jgi:hypothetical protein
MSCILVKTLHNPEEKQILMQFFHYWLIKLGKAIVIIGSVALETDDIVILQL